MKTKKCTLIFPRQNDKIGLALKKQPIHIGKDNLRGSENIWNGWGGKMDWNDCGLILVTALREFFQEAGAYFLPWHLHSVAQIYFHWPEDARGNARIMHVYIYFLSKWKGAIKEGEEMGSPVFFAQNEIPYHEMMKGDQVFLPRLLAGERFIANMFFDKKDERGLPTLEIIKPLNTIPWHIGVYLTVLILWKKIF